MKLMSTPRKQHYLLVVLSVTLIALLTISQLSTAQDKSETNTEIIDQNWTTQTSNGRADNSYVKEPDFVLEQNKFAYYKENSLYVSSTEGGSFLLGSDVKIKQDKKINTSKRYTYSAMPGDVLNNMEFSEGMGFYSALQSADENKWLYVERNAKNSSYNLCSFDNDKKIRRIIFSQDNSPDPEYAFMLSSPRFLPQLES